MLGKIGKSATDPLRLKVVWGRRDVLHWERSGARAACQALRECDGCCMDFGADIYIVEVNERTSFPKIDHGDARISEGVRGRPRASETRTAPLARGRSISPVLVPRILRRVFHGLDGALGAVEPDGEGEGPEDGARGKDPDGRRERVRDGAGEAEGVPIHHSKPPGSVSASMSISPNPTVDV